MKVCVNYNDARWRKYKIDFDRVANMAGNDLSPQAEVSIILTNDKEIHELNKRYRNIDKPTNVLSFELGDDILLGDIYISLDTVLQEARTQNIPVRNHIMHMVVHGMLHLQGYDHITDSDAEIMEAKEVAVLKKLKVQNPYVQDSAVCNDYECCPGGKFLSWLHRIKLKKNGFWQYVAMAVLGGVSALGFAPFHFWWATIIGIACAYALVVRMDDRPSVVKSFVRVFPFSAVYAVAMFWWVVNSIYVVPELASQFAIWTIPALIGIGLVGGIIFAIPFVVILRICTFPAYRPFLFASIWTLVLWLREWLFTGFPWNPVANISINMPWVANSMSVWGALGLTFIITGLIASAVELMRYRKSGACWYVFILFLALMCVGACAGVRNVHVAQNDNQVSPVIRLIQPARSASDKATHSRADAIRNATENINALYELSKSGGNPDLIVFPETSYPFVVVDGDSMPLADALNKDIIIGVSSYSDEKMYNSLIVADGDGKINHLYSKSHLVPFGEYRPFGDLIPTPGQLARGTGPEIITVDVDGRAFSFAPAICYEIIFSDSLIPGNETPDAIVNITNDTWFGNTPGTYQHLDMVRRYAIESGLPIIRANYSGISAFVMSDGSVASEIPVGRAGFADGMVYGAHYTPYRAIGRDGMMIIILLFSCVNIIAMNLIKRRK